MLALRKPNADAIRRFLESQREQPFSYSEVGATNDRLPSGYSINHTRRKLGDGFAVFESACAALRNWHQLRLGWVDCWPHDAPLRTGEPIAVLGRAFGLWWINACRIVYTINTIVESTGDLPGESTVASTGVLRFGYAHGTLPEHIASGEERFLIEMDSDEAVWLDILAFSRANSALARMGYSVMKREQRRFGRESADKLLSLTRHSSGPRTDLSAANHTAASSH
jgi:uncharacterized protein (UPF0548 family)